MGHRHYRHRSRVLPTRASTALVKLPELVALLNPVALALLAVGGVCYTAGVPFYIAKNVRYLHSVFHLWVLAGSIFQFMAVILFVI